MGELVKLDQTDNIAVITLDSQANRNALSSQLVAELADCVAAADTADTRVIVLRHEGPAFCSGGDLKERRAGTIPNSRPLIDVMKRLMDSPRPSIAAVDGAVRAGGIGLMASCDLVVVAESVTFALTEVRIGVAPAIISVPLFRRVAAGRVASAMLTGEPFDARRALDIGLVTHVAVDVVATVEQLCAGIKAGAPQAVGHTKAILRDVPHLDRELAFDRMQELSESLFESDEAAEGMAAFAEKRVPVWPG